MSLLGEHSAATFKWPWCWRLSLTRHSEAALLDKTPTTEGIRAAANVEVWAVWLEVSEAVNQTFRSLLSSDEVLRADRFASAALTASYQTSHGVLRVLLSRYLKRDPRELEFKFGWAGKPALKGDSGIHFNMSHSGALAAYVFTDVGPVGVDIEKIRNVPDLQEIAKHHFCREETAELLAIPGDEQRQEAFFRCWTRKESYVKALGDGLSAPLDQFQVTLLPDVPARFVHFASNDATAASWAMHNLALAPGYIGALCCKAGVQVNVHPVLSPQEMLEFIVV